MLLQSGAADGSSFILSKSHTTKLGGADTFVALLLCPIYKILHNKAPKHINFLNSDQSESSSNWLNIWKVKRDEKS